MVAVIAVVMGAAASAFTIHTPVNSDKDELVTTWFKFTGTDPTDLNQLKNNMEYEYVNGLPCSGEDLICAVRYTGVADEGEHPTAFSVPFQSRIAAVYAGGSDVDISEENE